MKYKFIGDTGLMVSELCLGTMTFGGKSGEYTFTVLTQEFRLKK